MDGGPHACPSSLLPGARSGRFWRALRTGELANVESPGEQPATEPEPEGRGDWQLENGSEEAGEELSEAVPDTPSFVRRISRVPPARPRAAPRSTCSASFASETRAGQAASYPGSDEATGWCSVSSQHVQALCPANLQVPKRCCDESHLHIICRML